MPKAAPTPRSTGLRFACPETLASASFLSARELASTPLSVCPETLTLASKASSSREPASPWRHINHRLPTSHQTARTLITELGNSHSALKVSMLAPRNPSLTDVFISAEVGVRRAAPAQTPPLASAARSLTNHQEQHTLTVFRPPRRPGRGGSPPSDQIRL